MKTLTTIASLLCALGCAASALAAPAAVPPVAGSPCPTAAELHDPQLIRRAMPAAPAIEALRFEVRPWKVEPAACAVLIATTARSPGTPQASIAIVSPGTTPI